MRDWSSNCAVDGVATLQGIECAFGNVVGVVLFLAGIVLFVMFLVGGFKYMTSGADPKAIEAAKGAITQAIMGAVVLILAFVILVIVEKITGVPVTQFRVTH